MATEDFKRILEGLRVAVAVVDARGAVTFGNACFAQLTGHGALDVIARPFASLFHADDVKRLEHNLARIADRKTASALLEVRTAGDEGKWVSLLLQPALDARDRPDGTVAVMQDIEAQRETESALNLAGARLLALAEASPNAAMVENLRGEIELANAAFCLLLGLESAPQSLPGLNALEVIAKAKNIDAKSFEKAKRKPDTPASVALKRDKGGAATLERQAIVVEGKPAGMLWTSKAPSAISQEDDRTAAEIVLIEKIGEELSVALEGLSAIAIRAQQMEFDPAMVENFQTIRLSTETAMAAIGDLVDFSKVQGGGGVVLRRSDFGLRAAVADLVKRVAPNAEEHGCRLRVKVEQDVADNLEGDVERLQLALKNLIDNAFQIFPGGEVSLQVTPEYVTESGIQLSFSVTVASDPGEKASPRASADAGMGVAVARFMVGAMGGKLAVASRLGAEALYGFTIEFPVRPTPAPPSRASYASLVAMPVLVVSEDPDQRLTLTNWFRGWRMVPIEADNAPMALALLERLHEEGSPVPLVILSNRLPIQDGFLLAFRIRHHRQLSATLMLMLSMDAKPGDAIACRENGIAAYLRYPVPDKQLNAAIVAVTGASLDADETPTLVTRHSLREQRKGATILLVDASRDSHMLAAHILRKRDCSLVAAGDFDEAVAALDQDMYDLVLVDTSLAGVDGPDAAGKLRAHIKRNPEATKIYATSLEHSVVFRVEKKEQGFDGSLGKPLRKDDLLGVLKAIGKLSEPGED